MTHSIAIEQADRTLTTSRRLRADAAELRAHAKVLLRRFRRLRGLQLAGGSDAADAAHPDTHQVLRDFCAGVEQPKCFVGYRRGDVCQVCGSPIRAGQLEYDLVTSVSSLRVDERCYWTFMKQSRAARSE